MMNSSSLSCPSSSSSEVTLRPFRLGDVDDLISWAGDDRVTGSLRWSKINSKEEAQIFITEVCIPHPWRRSICFKDRSIGYISIWQWSGDARSKADIGYALAVKYWGLGITTKAVKMAVSQVFKDLPDLVRLQAFVGLENMGSQRVLEKVGFLKDGHLRKYTYFKGDLKDLFVYSFIRSVDGISEEDQ